MVAMVAGSVTAAVSIAAGRAGLAASTRRQLTLAVAAGITAWLGLTALLAGLGLLESWGSAPPRVVLLPGVVLVVMITLNRRSTFGTLLARIPNWWPVAAQTARVGVELLLWGLLQQGRVPRQLTFEGRNLDVVIGLTAPVVAWLILRGRIGPRALLTWNAVGLASLVNVIVIASTSVPGPWRADWPGAPLTEIAHWPAVWIPAFLLPAAVFLHLASLRQTVPLLTRAALTPSRTS